MPLVNKKLYKSAKFIGNLKNLAAQYKSGMDRFKTMSTSYQETKPVFSSNKQEVTKNDILNKVTPNNNEPILPDRKLFKSELEIDNSSDKRSKLYNKSNLKDAISPNTTDPKYGKFLKNTLYQRIGNKPNNNYEIPYKSERDASRTDKKPDLLDIQKQDNLMNKLGDVAKDTSSRIEYDKYMELIKNAPKENKPNGIEQLNNNSYPHRSNIRYWRRYIKPGLMSIVRTFQR